jgi:hypothetical protein
MIRANSRITASGCWEWFRGRDSWGYGVVRHDLKSEHASRVSYRVYRGPIPGGMLVRHKCDNPPCVNPDHLELGTDWDNRQDSKKRDRPHKRPGISIATAQAVGRAVMLGETTSSIVRRLGVNNETVSRIRYGKTWSRTTGLPRDLGIHRWQKLSDFDVRAIRVMAQNHEFSHDTIGRVFGVSQVMVSKIVRGEQRSVSRGTALQIQ